jgi:hypothetical protein
MEIVLLLTWLVALAVLAPRYGADSRDRCTHGTCR